MRPGQLLLAVATAAALGLALRAALGHTLDPLWALACLFSYVGIVAAGIALPKLGMWADVLCRVENSRGVALTFEGGPHPVHTPVVLEILTRYGASATFFVTVEKAAKFPDLIRAIVDAGHEIGGLGEHPKNLLFGQMHTIVDDLVAMNRVLDRLDARASLLRPPGGFTHPRLPRAADGLGLSLVAWSIRAPEGRKAASKESVLRAVVPWLKDGEIVALRDALERGDAAPGSAEALPVLLEAISDRNLAAISVRELLRRRGEPGQTTRDERDVSVE